MRTEDAYQIRAILIQQSVEFFVELVPFTLNMYVDALIKLRREFIYLDCDFYSYVLDNCSMHLPSISIPNAFFELRVK